MAIEIVNRVISTVSDNRLALTNAQAARSISIGSNWNKIRIGFRLSFNRATGYTNAPPLFFGMCSGTTNLFMDTNGPLNFAGIQSQVRTWTYGSSNFYSGSGTNNTISFSKCVKVGTVATTGSMSYGTTPTIAPNIARTTGHIIELTKGTDGSTSWNISHWTHNTLATSNHTTSEALVSQMEAVTPTYINAISVINAVTVDEAVNGYLDTINFGWYGAAEAMEFSDIMWAKIA